MQITEPTAPDGPNHVDVLVVGSLNADLVTRAARLPGDGETVHGQSYARLAGGKGLNQAVAASRAGARTAMLGCVGDDDLGAFLVGQAREAGVGLAGVERLPGESTGVALIMVGGDGTNRIVVVAGANGRLDAQRIQRRVEDTATPVAKPCVVLCQLETPLDGVAAALAYARSVGAVSVLNPAPAAVLPSTVLASIDWLVPNEHEAALLLGPASDDPGAPAGSTRPSAAPAVSTQTVDGALEIARRLRGLGPRAVVVTLGARGAVAVDPEGTEHVIAPFPVDAVDTTAAGDAFCGTFVAGLAAGLPPEQALRRAAAAGALTATRHGAVPSIPTLAQVDLLLADG